MLTSFAIHSQASHTQLYYRIIMMVGNYDNITLNLIACVIHPFNLYQVTMVSILENRYDGSPAVIGAVPEANDDDININAELYYHILDEGTTRALCNRLLQNL